MSDIDIAAADLDSPDFDLSGLNLPEVPDGAPTSEPHPEDSSWQVREKTDQPTDTEPETTQQALEQAWDQQVETAEQAKTAQEDGRTWDREWRKLADSALESHGIAVAERHEAGISRREVVRRLFAAEALLRQDPVSGIARLAHDYARNADPEVRSALGQQVLAALGIEGGVGGLTAVERQELGKYREWIGRQGRGFQGNSSGF